VALRIPAGGDPARAERLLQKAEQSCLVTRSLKSTVHLHAQVRAG
jgi:organic hydroperoxide reductase OsmC/OhrA